MELHQYEKMILAALAGEKEPLAIEEVARKANLNKDAAMKAAMWLGEKKLVIIEAKEEKTLELTEEGLQCLKEGFPEITLVKRAKEGIEIGKLSEREKSIGIQWAKKKGWIRIDGGKVFATKEGEEGIRKDELRALFAKISEGKTIPQEIEGELTRRGLLSVNETNSYRMALTEEGMQKAQEFKGTIEQETNQITRKMLLDGSWKGAHLREYNISAPSEEPLIGKRHIIAKLAKKISGIFTEMGFEEMEGGMIESSFWNFDALFQPQDHPARDLADTFYLEGDSPLPKDSELVKRVKRSHQKGWKYSWQKKEAEKAILRTHTTCVSARTLYEKCTGKKEGRKFFSIGKVFRNEATDYKHLAEFFQVEGIVMWEDATFSHLMGFLTEFYKKMGFEKIRFVPSFFPYTEPSLEVHVWHEPKKCWMELGGAG
ncbi:phenylalanine--tRNA ligase subunit alpha, partial [Candidatus Micrarchaeota archaeon CG11_big_fil_rev_8_21_14_0_20_47_5]